MDRPIHQKIVLGFLMTTLLLISFVLGGAGVAHADAPVVASAYFQVNPDGGYLDPLGSDGFIASISNPGAITISNETTGEVVFQKALSFSTAADTAPQDWWSFNFLPLAPGLYSACGSIAVGSGYGGWSSCEHYMIDGGDLFHFQKARNTAKGLVVPLQVNPALVGQRLQVHVSWYRMGRRWWKRVRGSRQYQTVLQAAQQLHVGHSLRRNQRVTISVSFPGLMAGSSEGSNSFNPTVPVWYSLQCSDTVNGPVIPLYPAGIRANFRGTKSYCL